MHTQGHAVINLALLGEKGKPRYTVAALAGAILPDLTIVVFYLWERLIRHLPTEEIWHVRYFQPGPWQDLIDGFHSFPFAIAGFLLAKWQQREAVAIFFVSLLFHSLLDLPVHQQDAHRHFYPLSNWRWRSPVSYWDPRHHGASVMLVELSLVFLSSYVIWRRGLARSEKVALLIANLCYLPAVIFILCYFTK